MKESKFQPGDLVRHVTGYVEGALLLVELSTGRTSDFDYTWHALGPRGMLLVWESNLTLINREERQGPCTGGSSGPLK